MRLWHYELIDKGLLPNQQLISQWRELNSIFDKEPKHILINYVYLHDKQELFVYTLKVLFELQQRGYGVRKMSNMCKYFNCDTMKIASEWNRGEYKRVKCFEYHHNEEYLKICCWNLYEKYLRGQSGFSKECVEFIKKEIDL